jgi:hypothetical protein
VSGGSKAIIDEKRKESNRGEDEMQVNRNAKVRTSVEVRCGPERFRVGAQAQSIEGAVNLVKGLYSTKDVKVVFPIDPEGFFVGDSLAAEGLIERDKPQEEEQVA